MRPGPRRPGVRAHSGRCRRLRAFPGWRVRPAVGRSRGLPAPGPLGPASAPPPGRLRLLLLPPSPPPPPPPLSSLASPPDPLLPTSRCRAQGWTAEGSTFPSRRSCFKVRKRPLGLRGRPIRGDLVTASSRSPAPPAAQTYGQGWAPPGWRELEDWLETVVEAVGPGELFPLPGVSSFCLLPPPGVAVTVRPRPSWARASGRLVLVFGTICRSHSGVAQAGIGAGSAQPTADA